MGWRFDAIRAKQVRSVGTAFLRARPLIVAPIAALNGMFVASSGAPKMQGQVIAIAILCALVLFMAERWWLSRAVVGERWLACSLVLTAAMLSVACLLSGGTASPMLPLVLAPIVVAAAAFGRSWRTIATSALAFVLVALLAVIPPVYPAIPDPWSRGVVVTSFAGLLLLAYTGVAGLVEAYVQTGKLLENMRAATLEEAAGRMRASQHIRANLAHELKNPLAAIKALLQILRDRVDEKGTKRLEVALAEVDRMDVLVREYLTFARPLAELEVGDVELRALADDVANVLADRAAQRRIALEARGARVRIRGDLRRLREAVFNLTTNAIAATPAGGSVTIETTPIEGGARVTVSDTGSGMPAALVDAPSFTTTHAEGTGLGLPIARGVVAQHGGELGFAPRPGGGTIATMTLRKDLP
ncbi:MAG: HAMP domain-containing histidine kinase [Myxococcota bacterium]|nr:HAMP domain-containing histidine kinase [Myxococcota bacterium]